MRSTKQERDMVKAIAEKRLFDEVMPNLRKILKSGGGADQVLKSSEPYAAATLVGLLQSEKEDIRRQAANDVLNRTQGKPIERNMTLYGDLSKMDDDALDRQLQLLLRENGDSAVAQLLEVKPKKQLKAPRQARKPRKLSVDVTPEPIKG